MSVLIVVTRLRLSEPRHRRKFLTAAAAAIAQATATSGNLGTEVLPESDDVYWTRTAWNDRDSLSAFMTAEPHLGLRERLDEWCDEASFVEWEQPTPEFPDWPTAAERLVSEGRSPTLTRPSPDHRLRSFPPVSRR